MKKIFILPVLVTIAFSPLMAQVKGQSLSGATGLYTVPTGQIGWDKSNFALDFGYRAIINDEYNGIAHIPSITLSFVKMFEFSFAYDVQPDPDRAPGNYNNDDLLFGFKLQLPTGKTAIALGLNLNLNERGLKNQDFTTYQPYIAITYPGNFFTWPAETTMFIGKTFYERNNNSDVDFGMGFDLILLPDLFNGLIHLIVDFSNFAYSSDAFPWNLVHRGVFNGGFRFDLSKFPIFSKYKFTLDTAFNDILDDNQRSFTIGACFGIPLM